MLFNFDKKIDNSSKISAAFLDIFDLAKKHFGWENLLIKRSSENSKKRMSVLSSTTKKSRVVYTDQGLLSLTFMR